MSSSVSNLVAQLQAQQAEMATALTAIQTQLAALQAGTLSPDEIAALEGLETTEAAQVAVAQTLGSATSSGTSTATDTSTST